MKTYDKVYKLVKKIPKGKVMTYGQIGQILDLNPRVVGWALNRLAKCRVVGRGAINRALSIDSQKIPWHRVINSKGGISTNKLMNIPLGLQKKLLERENIRFDKDGKIDLKRYLWKKLTATSTIE